MSRRAGANKTRRATHDTWETCVDLPAFLADGIFAFMADASYEFKTGASVPAAYKGKGGTLAAARLVCKDLRAELDSRIRDWMLVFHDKLVHMREKIVRAENVPAHYLLATQERYTPEQIEEFNRINATKKEAQQDFEKHVVPLLGDDIATAIGWDVQSQDPMTLSLGFDVCTFMCMATQRCQVHGPMGVGRCRNVCCVSKINFGGATNSNFACVTFGDNKICLYAREKCVDAVCIKPDSRFLSNSDNSVSTNTARNMFRAKGVYHPFSTSEVNLATNAWGAVDSLPSGDSRGVRMVSAANWPRKIFLMRHPAVSDSNASIQQVLGLTDNEAKACRADAIRKAGQKIEREQIINKRIVDELIEDLDVYMKRTPSIPVGSVGALGDICPGMEKSVRIAVREMHHSRHVLDIDDVRNAMETVSFFLGPVLTADRQAKRDVASSEAYDFVSGMHFGRYGVRCPAWKPSYASMKTFTKVPTEEVRVKHSVLALRFFDELNESSLCVASSRQDTLPDFWMLSAGSKTIVFKAVFYGSYDDYMKLHDQVSFLLTESDVSTRLPKLFPKLVHTYATTMHGNRKQCLELKEWVMNTFKLLVGDPSTRCAALDILNLAPSRMIDLLGARCPDE